MRRNGCFSEIHHKAPSKRTFKFTSQTHKSRHYIKSEPLNIHLYNTYRHIMCLNGYQSRTCCVRNIRTNKQTKKNRLKRQQKYLKQNERDYFHTA